MAAGARASPPRSESIGRTIPVVSASFVTCCFISVSGQEFVGFSNLGFQYKHEFLEYAVVSGVRPVYYASTYVSSHMLDAGKEAP